MDCNSCKGTGSIFRPPGRIVQEIVRSTEIIDGERFEVKETVITETGGIDACPACAGKAEAEYRISKGHPRSEIRRIA